MARLSLDLMGEKDIAFPDWQKFYVAILVDRLTWNPVARQHFDDVNKLVGGYQYSLMDLGRQDAKKILEKLNQNFGPRWEGHNNTLMQQRWRYAKAYVLRSFSAKLLLPEISKAAKVIEEEAVKNIRENYWVCSSPEAYEKLASDAEKLVAMLPFHCKVSELTGKSLAMSQTFADPFALYYSGRTGTLNLQIQRKSLESLIRH
jgi:hypothetical protein